MGPKCGISQDETLEVAMLGYITPNVAILVPGKAPKANRNVHARVPRAWSRSNTKRLYIVDSTLVWGKNNLASVEHEMSDRFMSLCKAPRTAG